MDIADHKYKTLYSLLYTCSLFFLRYSGIIVWWNSSHNMSPLNRAEYSRDRPTKEGIPIRKQKRWHITIICHEFLINGGTTARTPTDHKDMIPQLNTAGTGIATISCQKDWKRFSAGVD